MKNISNIIFSGMLVVKSVAIAYKRQDIVDEIERCVDNIIVLLFKDAK